MRQSRKDQQEDHGTDQQADKQGDQQIQRSTQKSILDTIVFIESLPGQPSFFVTPRSGMDENVLPVKIVRRST